MSLVIYSFKSMPWWTKRGGVAAADKLHRQLQASSFPSWALLGMAGWWQQLQRALCLPGDCGRYSLILRMSPSKLSLLCLSDPGHFYSLVLAERYQRKSKSSVFMSGGKCRVRVALRLVSVRVFVLLGRIKTRAVSWVFYSQSPMQNWESGWRSSHRCYWVLN